jgi:hypothetical protein
VILLPMNEIECELQSPMDHPIIEKQSPAEGPFEFVPLVCFILSAVKTARAADGYAVSGYLTDPAYQPGTPSRCPIGLSSSPA